ncbi:MAG: XRE family transcriptional regulator [Bdellovibrionales bacterium]|nr:XRE family transcriptional regulator [Bdellovibrionales bacterium]
MTKYKNEQLFKIEEKAKKNKKNLTHITDKSGLSAQDRVKLDLCKHFVQFSISKKMKSKEVAELVGIPRSRMSEVVNYKIDKFTVDQLLKFLSSLAEHDAQIREYLVFFGSAAELPALSVAHTKRLTRDLREAAL